ncbi:MAG: PspC domain-containing protein [Muribaculaceae bacterium]|nr:PspC domain-containing protein [Muribaculaceae bacterium]
MKKTFPVNINGKVFYIDEDAYELLLNYLDQLRSAFSGAEGEEIVTDIEGRISELFDERIYQGANAIVYTDVNRVIEIMGKPSDISETDEAETPADSVETSTQTPPRPETAPQIEDVPTEKKKLFRNVNNKVLGGVLSGLATYLDWDANILRVLYLVLAIATYFWPLTFLYLVAWMIIPPANTPRRVLEMRGEPVTVDSIGQTVLSTATPPPYVGFIKENRSVFTQIFSFIGKCIMGFLGIIGALGAVVATGFTLFFLVAFIAAAVFNSYEIIDWMHSGSSIIVALAFMCVAMCFIIPGIALSWAAVSVIFNSRGASKTTIFIALVLEIIFVVAAFVLVIYTENYQYYHHYY